MAHPAARDGLGGVRVDDVPRIFEIRQGLIEQLEFEQYSTEAAQWAVDNVVVDWSAQALLSAFEPKWDAVLPRGASGGPELLPAVSPGQFVAFLDRAEGEIASGPVAGSGTLR